MLKDVEMRACNNNNMRHSKLSVCKCMYASVYTCITPPYILSGYACHYYWMPSSPCCCIYTALVSLIFGTVIPFVVHLLANTMFV